MVIFIAAFKTTISKILAMFSFPYACGRAIRWNELKFEYLSRIYMVYYNRKVKLWSWSIQPFINGSL